MYGHLLYNLGLIAPNTTPNSLIKVISLKKDQLIIERDGKKINLVVPAMTSYQRRFFENAKHYYIDIHDDEKEKIFASIIGDWYIGDIQALYDLCQLMSCRNIYGLHAVDVFNFMLNNDEGLSMLSSMIEHYDVMKIGDVTLQRLMSYLPTSREIIQKHMVSDKKRFEKIFGYEEAFRCYRNSHEPLYVNLHDNMDLIAQHDDVISRYVFKEKTHLVSKIIQKYWNKDPILVKRLLDHHTSLKHISTDRVAFQRTMTWMTSHPELDWTAWCERGKPYDVMRHHLKIMLCFGISSSEWKVFKTLSPTYCQECENVLNMSQMTGEKPLTIVQQNHDYGGKEMDIIPG